MTAQPFAWDRTTQPFTCRDRRIIQTFPPPFPTFEGIIQFMPNYYPNISPLFEGIIYSYQRLKYLDLSERLDINVTLL